MKTQIPIRLASYPTGMTEKAQSEAETLDWLKLNPIEIISYGCYSNAVGCHHSANELEINKEHIKLIQKDDEIDNYTRIPWNKIKEIEDTGYGCIQIIGQEKIDGETDFVILKLKNQERISKYTKALKQMAALNGAKLMNDGLLQAL
jgi:hypothetical protein